MSLTPGTRLGPYEITGPLGEGGMGEVYRARDTALGRDVAVKVLPAAVATDPDSLARFRREAEALAALNHPNIAQVYGVQESSGPGVQESAQQIRAIVMEFVDGGICRSRLRAARCRSTRRCQLRGRWPRRSRRRTSGASSTAI